MRGRWLSWGALATMAFVLVSCSPWVDGDQTRIESGADLPLEPGLAIGQTFVARHAGLSAIEIWLDPGEPVQGEIRLHLRSSPHATEDLATAALLMEEGAEPGFHRFSFPSIRESHSGYYYAFLEVSSGTEVEVGTAPVDVYPDGALHQDHLPRNGQTSFRLVYDPRWLVIDLARAAAEALGLLGLAGLVYVVPGWGLLTLLRPGRGDAAVGHWAEGLGVAAGLSLALYPLLFLWTSLVGLRLGPLYTWLPVGIGGILLLRHYRPWRIQWRQGLGALTQRPRSRNLWPDVALVIIVIVAALGRFLSVRGLDMPLWDDSVQHTVIVQRILEAGGLFQSWEPYAPYASLSTHFGFHANVAVWAWLTGEGAPQAVIRGGQVLNLLAALSLYPLAYRLKGAWGGNIAVLAAGVLSMFPAYYTNWGRYPQMAGQIILAIAAWWLWRTAQRSNRGTGIGWILEGACLAGGMILTYYRMAFHCLAFAVAMVLVVVRTRSQAPRRRNWLALGAIVVATGLLALPWLYHAAISHPLALSIGGAGAPGETTGFWQQLEGIHVGWSAPHAAVVALGTLTGILLGGPAALPVIWLWALVGLPVLRLTPLPGVHYIQEFTIYSSLYIPEALIWGVCGGHLAARIATWKRWCPAALSLLIVGLAAWKGPALSTTLDRGFDLSSRPDMRAADWIEESLPEDAFFLINGIVYTDGRSAVGGDAGWWLPVLTRRGVVIPPQYALLAEEPNEPGYSDAVNGLVKRLFETSPVSSQGLAAICSFPRPITHVYLGQRDGMAAETIFPPPHPMLPADLLLESPAFRLIYHEDRVLIFEFERTVCP